jgi:uncharacterized membrane protein
MIQVTFTPGTSAQAALVGQLMAQYLALDEQPQEPVRTTSGLIAAAQEEAAAPAPKRTRRAATPEASAPVEPTPGPSADAQATAPTEDPKPAAAAAAAEPELTLEVVRAKLTEVSKAGKAPEVKALLAALGVANLTAVPKEAYAKLMADAAAL